MGIFIGSIFIAIPSSASIDYPNLGVVISRSKSYEHYGVINSFPAFSLPTQSEDLAVRNIAVVSVSSPNEGSNEDQKIIPGVLVISRASLPKTQISIAESSDGKSDEKPLFKVGDKKNINNNNGAAFLRDLDADGMPDVWETIYGIDQNKFKGSSGANQDSDSDGYTDLFEYIAGTHPRNADSHFFLQLKKTPENEVTILEYNTVLDRVYTLYCSEDLVTWVVFKTVVGDNKIHTTEYLPKEIKSTNSRNNSGKYFFKIEIEIVNQL